MWCGVITVFPEMFTAITEYGITARAVKNGLLDIQYWNPRDFTTDSHRTIDDRPYGGGPGMVMKPEPLMAAIAAAKAAAPAPAQVIYVSPVGKKLDHAGVMTLAASQPLIFIAGRYEGIDERIVTQAVDACWSIGDYVISGGELATMVIIDAMTRWIPGALNHAESAASDSFVEGLLDCPHYTRPAVFRGEEVPAVLQSGDHAAIAAWRHAKALERTRLYRPDLLD